MQNLLNDLAKPAKCYGFEIHAKKSEVTRERKCSEKEVRGGRESRVWSAQRKFTDLNPVLAEKGTSRKKKYKSCVESVLLYGSEIWPMRVKGARRLEYTEKVGKNMARKCK